MSQNQREVQVEQSSATRFRLDEFVRQAQPHLVALNEKFVYAAIGVQLAEEDTRSYLEEPVAALPPNLVSSIPPVAVLLVPYLERPRHGWHSGEAPNEWVTLQPPEPKHRIWCARLFTPEWAAFALALKDQELADYHYHFFHLVAELAAEHVTEQVFEDYCSLLREELASRIHGEVDEESWERKQELLRRARNPRRRTKGFNLYAKQSFIDTLALYLHGICCDIDVETGPRQLPSHRLRRRLEYLKQVYPPPPGYAVFPEDLSELELNRPELDET